MTATPNAAQIEYWTIKSGPTWVTMQPRIDALFAPLMADLLTFADVAAGSRVLDIGCGCGASVLALAEAVGASGTVLGIDVSAPMLAVAEQRIAAAGLGHATVLCADAATHAFAPAAIEHVVSRLGVMFFDDPPLAFRHIRGAVVPGGRLSFVCWQPLNANQWYREPVETVLPLLGPQAPSEPDAPGPFAFADPERVRGILGTAGWSDVAIAPLQVSLRFGDVEAATHFLSKVGGAARLLAEASLDIRAMARAALAARLAAFDGPDGVVLGGALWLVAART